MRRLYGYLAALIVLGAALAYVATAGAGSPPPNAVPDNFTITNPTSYGYTADVYIEANGALLPTSACAFASADPRTGVHPNLRAGVRGWQVIPDQIDQPRLVSLHAHVHGTIDDAQGRSYRLAGSFDEDGLQPFHVPFDGFGHLTLAGKRGEVTGDARFTYVSDNPIEWSFQFSNIQNCSIH